MLRDTTLIENLPVDEVLESRQLLSIDTNDWQVLTPIDENQPICVDEDEPSTAKRAPASSALAAVDDLPTTAQTAAATSDHVDANAVRDGLIRFVDMWNGGQLGKLGTSGMGAYAASWDGLFRMNLDRQFNQTNYYTNDQTIISQARAIYINVEAYRNASAADQARFRNAVQRGADYLLAKAVDPSNYNGKPGGMWWGLQPDGVSPPIHTTAIYGTAPRHKEAYGQVQALFALAQAYSVTGDIDHLNGALKQLDVWNGQFADTAAGAGAFLPTANENYTQRVAMRNLDYMTHALEALLTLNDVLPASDPRKATVTTQVTNVGNFITTRMYRDMAGSTTTGYLPWFYDAQWNPPADAGQQYTTPGHCFEVAFLLSRAVERGFNANWLNVANKLLAFSVQYGFDNVPTSPTYSAVLDEKLKLDGTRFNQTPDNLIWWQSSEAARTLLHFAVVRGRTDLWDEYDAATAFIQNHFIDPTYGGWFTYLNPSTFVPTDTNKGTVWTGGYHETMLDAERIRVAPSDATTPVTLGSTADAYVRDGASAGANYGTTVDLQVKKDAVGWNRETYVMFPLAGISSVSTAKLRLFGNLQSTIGVSIPVDAYGAAGTNWSDTGLNWNNRPATDASALASQSLPDSTGRWYEWDVTAFVRDQVAQGKSAVTLCLRTSQSGTAAIFNSDEAPTNKPQLLVTTSATVPQGLVLSSNTVKVPEGGSAQFTVKLATAPTADVTVTASRGSGDADINVSAGETLLFTPANWNVPQTVMIGASQDADSTSGSAVIEVSSAGLTTQTVTATELDDDAAVAPISVRAVADAYVRDGTYAGQTFGTAADLQLKSAAAGWNRESYLRFDLSGVSNVGSAKLRLYGRLDNTSSPSVAFGVYGSANTTWSESAINWNNRPSAGTSVLVSGVVSGTAGKWYELDLTGYVQQQKSAGASAITLVLKASAASNSTILFESDEAVNRPELLVSATATAAPGLIVSTPSLAVPEGFTAAFDVRLSSAPTANVIVTITKQAGGEEDLSAAKTALTFTPANWSVAQSVNVTAVEDADTVSGSATYVLSIPGGQNVNVVVSEIENDTPSTSVSLRATADAYVRDGTYAGSNFGSAPDLVVKRSVNAGNSRETFVSFDISAVSDIATGKLRLYGRLSDTTAASLVATVYPAPGAAWGESTINWNNRPVASSTALGTITVAGTTAKWYELDVSPFLAAEKAAGRNRINFVLRNFTSSDAQTLFASDEAAANRPELLVSSPATAAQDVDTRVMAAVGLAGQRLRQTLNDLGTDPAKYVQVTGPNGKWNVVDADTWTSAMLPASLWYMAKETGDAYWITEAIRRTTPLQSQKTQVDDLAFRLGYAYWPLYAATGNAMYRQVLIDAAASKVSTYNGTVGAFRSPFRASTSGNPAADFGVLTDQITDVELVLWAANATVNTAWTDMAIRHLQTMAANVVRPDGSTYQWTYFNSQNGQFVGGEAYQGYSANSTWSRGQAWAIYGFTAAYRLTARAEFLTAAKRVANWYLEHLPAGDMVPYWDFNAPGIPNTYKDSSAAAVAASGFAQLATLVPDPADAAKYRKAAADTLFQLASPQYLSSGTNSRGVLLHGAWFVPPPMEVGDTSTIWGDYFFLEAINRYMAAK